MAKKKSNICSCYHEYPNPNHNYCSEFIRISNGKYFNKKGYCVRRSALGMCLDCLKLQNCKEVLRIKEHSDWVIFGCTDYEE